MSLRRGIPRPGHVCGTAFPRARDLARGATPGVLPVVLSPFSPQEESLFTYVIYICIIASLGAAAALFCALSFETIRDV